jgi:hypothetical protein
MTQSISVVYSDVQGTYGLGFHMAIVYDKGDGSVPLVIEAGPSIPIGDTNKATPEQLEQQPIEARNELFFGEAGLGNQVNSPFGTVTVNPVLPIDQAYNGYDVQGLYPNYNLAPSTSNEPPMSLFQETLVTGGDLSNQWSSILNTGPCGGHGGSSPCPDASPRLPLPTLRFHMTGNRF